LLESRSSVLSATFSLPPINGDLEGQTEDEPICLEGAKKEDFDMFPTESRKSIQVSCESDNEAEEACP